LTRAPEQLEIDEVGTMGLRMISLDPVELVTNADNLAIEIIAHCPRHDFAGRNSIRQSQPVNNDLLLFDRQVPEFIFRTGVGFEETTPSSPFKCSLEQRQVTSLHLVVNR
jgi:hypothetical protein